jgi:hypothetical protein
VGTAARGAADYRQYTITVKADNWRHTVRLADPVEDPALQRLIHFLPEQAKRAADRYAKSSASCSGSFGFAQRIPRRPLSRTQRPERRRPCTSF